MQNLQQFMCTYHQESAACMKSLLWCRMHAGIKWVVTTYQEMALEGS